MRELQKMQALFMKTNLLDQVYMKKQRFCVFRITWREDGKVLGDIKSSKDCYKAKNTKLLSFAIEEPLSDPPRTLAMDDGLTKGRTQLPL